MSAARPAAPRHSAVAFFIATLGAMLGLPTALMLLAPSAQARLLAVGPGHVLKVPSQASMVAQPGDVVQIDPGTYADCTVWRTSRITVETTGPGVVIAGKVCEERGLFVVYGNDFVVRGVTFRRGRGFYHNAAGIRMFGRNLTVENSRFVENENGILAGGPPDSVVHVTDSVFEGNGSCEGACAHAIYGGGPFALLDVERCRFFDTRIAHHIKSRARATMVIGNRIEDGANGTSSYLVELPVGGNALIQDNVLQKGRHSDNPSVAISFAAEGLINPTEVLIVRDNSFTSDLPEQTLFVRNGTAVPVTLSGNRLSGKVKPLDGPGMTEP